MNTILIPGNFYTFECDNSDVWYFKLKSIKKTKILLDGYYICNGSYCESPNPKSHFKFKDYGNTIKKIHFEKIKKYFPDDHIEHSLYRKQKINTLLKLI